MAPKKLEDATLEDLEQIFEKYGHKPQIALGLAVAARAIPSPSGFDVARRGFDRRKTRFLSGFLGEYDGSSLAGEIYAEVTNQLIGLSTCESFFRASMVAGKSTPYAFHHLIDFLGQHSTFEGMRGRVKDFLRDVSNKRLVAQGSTWWARTSPALATLPWESLTRVLLRYQMFDELGRLVERRIYEAIPVLFEVVVEQVGEANAYGVVPLVMGGWDVPKAIVKAFQSIGKDSRALRLLLDLSQAYLNEHRRSYPLEKAVLT